MYRFGLISGCPKEGEYLRRAGTSMQSTQVTYNSYILVHMFDIVLEDMGFDAYSIVYAYHYVVIVRSMLPCRFLDRRQ
jgi:hypothetical protein